MVGSMSMALLQRLELVGAGKVSVIVAPALIIKKVRREKRRVGLGRIHCRPAVDRGRLFRESVFAEERFGARDVFGGVDADAVVIVELEDFDAVAEVEGA